MLVTAAKLIGAGIGIGTVFGAFIIGMSRNPSMEQKMFKFCLMGFALTEAMALFVLIIAFLIIFMWSFLELTTILCQSIKKKTLSQQL